LEKKLEEGYRASSKENTVLVKEFEAVDLEGWDEAWYVDKVSTYHAELLID
jgi:hypothetical protein